MAIVEDKYNSALDLSAEIDTLIPDIETEEKLNSDAWWFENYSYYKMGILMISSFLFSFLTFYYLYETFWDNGLFGGLGFLTVILTTIINLIITVNFFIYAEEGIFNDKHRFIKTDKNISLIRTIENYPELLIKMKEILSVRQKLTVYEYNALKGLAKQEKAKQENQQLLEFIDKKII